MSSLVFLLNDYGRLIHLCLYPITVLLSVIYAFVYRPVLLCIIGEGDQWFQSLIGSIILLPFWIVGDVVYLMSLPAWRKDYGLCGNGFSYRAMDLLILCFSNAGAQFAFAFLGVTYERYCQCKFDGSVDWDELVKERCQKARTDWHADQLKASLLSCIGIRPEDRRKSSAEILAARNECFAILFPSGSVSSEKVQVSEAWPEKDQNPNKELNPNEELQAPRAVLLGITSSNNDQASTFQGSGASGSALTGFCPYHGRFLGTEACQKCSVVAGSSP